MTFLKRILLLIVCLALASSLAAQTPAITFTSVPSIGSNANLFGRVTNVTPSAYRVAVYIFVQGWWTKPSDGAAQTVIQNDGTWTCDITTGGADAYATKVAAFLIPQSYAPPIAHGTATLPAAFDTNAVAKVVADRTSASAIHWCGYDWEVKNTGPFAFGPGPNLFSDSLQNVWVDGTGRLHLRITNRNGQWYCAEVVSRRAFGYGTYRFFLASAEDTLDPNVVFGMFTYDDDPTASNGHRELDVELSRWSNPGDPTNAQFVVQPFDVPGNLTRWTLPAGAAFTTHSFTWSNARVDFVSHNGLFAPPPASVPQTASWSRLGASVPAPGDERVHLNLWLFNTAAPANGQEVEVIISRFAFIPAQPAVPRVQSLSLDNPGAFHLQLSGEPQLWYRLERSVDLTNWTSLGTTIAPEAAFELMDPTAAPAAKKFYRASVVPGQ